MLNVTFSQHHKGKIWKSQPRLERTPTNQDWFQVALPVCSESAIEAAPAPNISPELDQLPSTLDPAMGQTRPSLCTTPSSARATHSYYSFLNVKDSYTKFPRADAFQVWLFHNHTICSWYLYLCSFSLNRPIHGYKPCSSLVWLLRQLSTLNFNY